MLEAITIPLFSGAIGYLTNWSGVWMLFNPLRFRGVRVPGLAPFARILPRKLQEIPGVMHGGLGWQGIIPSRAAKMGSIAVDKGIAKVGNASDFYAQLDTDAIAEAILANSRREIRSLVERIMQREHPGLWRDLPPRAREAVFQRVEQQLPEVVGEVTDEIGRNIDDLLDVKLMVIRHLEAHPELVNRVFLETGPKELKFIVNFGFFFGFVLGIPVVFIVEALPYWWVLPICGTVVGWVTNWLALWMIFEPTTPRKLGPFTLHGLFLRRQRRAAAAYAGVIADDIVTMRNIATELTEGPRADRTRSVIRNALAPTVDRAVGRARAAVRVAVGAREYDAIRESVATEAYEYAVDPLADEELNKRQSERLQVLITERIQELDSPDFSELLRSAMREDEWLLLLHGAVLGFGAGLIHLAIFGV
jgi:uncharacterized membrane protein YheB (UPF0754 family)